jgi:hypothetical protein
MPAGLQDLRACCCPLCGENALLTDHPIWEDAEIVTISARCWHCKNEMSIVYQYLRTNSLGRWKGFGREPGDWPSAGTRMP